MQNSEPWIEKYRPTKLDDIILGDNIKDIITIFLTNQSNVHLLITGLPGIGKTTTVGCIVKELYKDTTETGYIEINATDDKSVKNVTSVIPAFCKKVYKHNVNKTIIFDEADNLTAKCQHDINNMIKEYGRKTKFIFICNESHKIIEDIQSVCRIIRFRRLSKSQITGYLINICDKEAITYDDEGLDTICYIADGDMRKAINDLQKTAYTFRNITKDNVLNVCQKPDPKEIKHIISACLNNDLIVADEKLNFIIEKGYCCIDIVNGFVHAITICDEIIENDKLNLIDIIYQTKIALSIGLRSKLQLFAMLCKIIKYIETIKNVE